MQNKETELQNKLKMSIHLSPTAHRTERVGPTGEHFMPMRQQDLHVVVAVFFGLAFVLAHLDLFWGSRPVRLLMLAEAS